MDIIAQLEKEQLEKLGKRVPNFQPGIRFRSM